jgi:hypothetical protein
MGPIKEVGMGPIKEVGMGPIKEVGMGPIKEVGMGPIKELGMGPIKELGMGPIKEVGMGPIKKVKEVGMGTVKEVDIREREADGLELLGLINRDLTIHSRGCQISLPQSEKINCQFDHENKKKQINLQDMHHALPLHIY